MARKQGVPLVTLIIILGLAIILLSPTGQTFIQGLLGGKVVTPTPTPTGYIYSGQLTVNLNTYDLYDDLAQNPEDGVDIKIYHADQSTPFGTATTLDGTDTITGTVDPSDNGILYLAIDHDAGGTEYYLDSKTAAVNTLLTAMSPQDIDADGTLEHYFKLDVSGLSPLQAGETAKTITLNLYCMLADVSGLDWTVVLNPSGDFITGIDATAEGYMTAVTEGCGFKIVRVELTMPTAGNETYVEDGKVKNVWVQIGTNKWTVLSWQPGQDRFLVWEASDVTQEVNGKDFFYGKNAGTTWLRYSVHIYGKGFGSAAVWNPTLKITVINPVGTISTVSETLTFTDT